MKGLGISKAEVLERARAMQVRFVRLQFTDILGVVKNVAIPVERLNVALDGHIVFDGSALEGFVRVEEYDLVLEPDLDSFAVFPWKTDGTATARLMCDIRKPDGSPFMGCPRTILKRVVDDAEAAGFSLLVGPEPEFFLFHRDNHGEATAHPTDQAGYFDLSPSDSGENVRREMILALEEMGFQIEGAHHEVAPGQHEIDFAPADPVTTADNIVTFRFVVRTVAQHHNFHATFMPKPLFGVNGSGLHLHQSLFKGRTNVFYHPDTTNGLSKLATQYIAGLIRHAPALTAVANPLVNSYKRLVPGYEAPVYIAWSAGNRSPMIRVPAERGHDTRIELRSPDPSCNPYLALAVAIRAGMDGIAHQWEAPAPVRRNIYRMSDQERHQLGIQSLPQNLEAALDCLERDPVMLDALGAELGEWYIEAKRIEWDVYRQQVHSWETEQYLTTY